MRPQTENAADVGSSAAYQRILISGQVQGVGFRPMVYRVAQQRQISGVVRNIRSGVEILLRGTSAQAEQLLAAIEQACPPLAQIEHTAITAVADVNAESIVQGKFRIEHSQTDSGANRIGIPPDTSLCNACLQELFDPSNRRWRYPFINCTQCGPRYSLIEQLPYDRPHTSMRLFEQCAACGAEYSDPVDRRFHAQPNACAECGPTLWLEDPHSATPHQPLAGDPIALTVSALKAGKIIAMRSVGGFHLVCDADHADAVERLHQLKQRGDKPFALMMANSASLATVVKLTPAGTAALNSGGAPIVLQYSQPDSAALLQQRLAPALGWLGVMLPHTPLHWLLFHQAAGQPSGTDWCEQVQSLKLVMTSGNRRGQPLVTCCEQARSELAPMADLLLLHNREIINRIDDTVVDARESGLAQPIMVRRGRGYAPAQLRLEPALATQSVVLGLGSYLKNTQSIAHQNSIVLSAPLGDLDQAENCRLIPARAQHMSEQFNRQVTALVAEYHPNNPATQYAQQQADAQSLPLQQLAHHPAHLLAGVAEHRELQQRLINGESVIGLVLDGTGLGWDNRTRGGELLRISGDATAVAQRFPALGPVSSLSALEPMMLPGGDKAAREPWRLLVSLLKRCGAEDQLAPALQRLGMRMDVPAVAMVQQMMARQINSPTSSSLGRLFDAIAALAGICAVQQFEGEAPMKLEALVDADQLAVLTATAPVDIQLDSEQQLQLSAALKALLTLTDPVRLATAFHALLIQQLSAWVKQFAKPNEAVVLAGGCFLNAHLRAGVSAQLRGAGHPVFMAEHGAIGDGGVSLGQVFAQLWQQYQNRDSGLLPTAAAPL